MLVTMPDLTVDSLTKYLAFEPLDTFFSVRLCGVAKVSFLYYMNETHL